MRELLNEVWTSLRSNKLRSILTGFSVSWGIFMLVILLGAGQGLQNAAYASFKDMAVNSMQIGLGRTSMAYKGFQIGRSVRLRYDDVEMLQQKFPQITQIALQLNRTGFQIVSNKEHLTVNLSGVTPNYASINGISVIKGRFINELDTLEGRKVMLIDEKTSNTLFPKNDPIGQFIKVRHGLYKIIGIYKENNWGSTATCYLPISTVKNIFYSRWPYLHAAILAVDGIQTMAESERFEQTVREAIASKRDFDPRDQKAMWIYSRIKQYLNMQETFGGISLFIWIIGIGTLMAGIVGVSNIMSVTVRERTYEMGVRKALGANPRSIVGLVLLESLIITTLFGYVGMLLGIGLIQMADSALSTMSETRPEIAAMFQHPSVDLSIVMSATLVLIIGGLWAGFVPARRAVQMKTVDALRFNK